MHTADGQRLVVAATPEQMDDVSTDDEVVVQGVWLDRPGNSGSAPGITKARKNPPGGPKAAAAAADFDYALDCLNAGQCLKAMGLIRSNGRARGLQKGIPGG